MKTDTQTTSGFSSEPPRSPGADAHQDDRNQVEGALREVVRRVLERGLVAGMETFNRTDKVIRGVVDDVKFPREIASYLFAQLDETRGHVVRVAAREIREFLQQTDLASEMQRLLTSLSFEVRTEVRFVPNDGGVGVRPSVRNTSIGPKRRSDRPSRPAATDVTDSETVPKEAAGLGDSDIR